VVVVAEVDHEAVEAVEVLPAVVAVAVDSRFLNFCERTIRRFSVFEIRFCFA
jgi:hypothetical protein